MGKTLRHACGQLVKADVFRSHGETISEFFDYFSGVRIESCPNCAAMLDIDWCGSPWLVAPMTDSAAQYTQTHKYCSNCWGMEFELDQARDMDGNPTGVRVICVHCREDTIGYVSDHYIRREQSEDYIHWRKDAAAISQALGTPAPAFRTQAENLEHLGF